MSMMVRENAVEFTSTGPWRRHAAAFHDALSGYRARYLGAMKIGYVDFESHLVGDPFGDVYTDTVFDVTAALTVNQNKPAMVRLTLAADENQAHGLLVFSHLRGAAGKDMFDVAWSALHRSDPRMLVR
ncbi:MAG: hypothetical protein L0H03_01055 [Rhodococcus sp. (in: high G+C Gram-positive bacteria)]|uniref:hypothetical protein n=1 Tax=Rhodococcus qingshengii TaxID=334542 RepID=UPI001C4E058D|nr:hypothetical protein [Rhodococcus qingshengii]MCD2136240.1 hypothetical protein [Rhodococcus qingshengii]MDN5543845.1 hypothetical protein [Rhodococcus sp. (in: high G+C Gram-positive bacteria)]